MEADEGALAAVAADAGGARRRARAHDGLEQGDGLYDAQRLIAKGAVSLDESGKYQQYSAAVAYAEVEPEETASFLTKVYGGSVGLMVSNLVGRGALSEQEIRELKAILDAAEQQED